jgi:hypothetical protein
MDELGKVRLPRTARNLLGVSRGKKEFDGI